MARTPFTQEVLLEIYDQNGIISFDLLMERLSGWRLADIKERLNQWRYRKVIAYTLKDDEIDSFEFLKNKKEKSQELTEGRKLKLDAYFRQVLATADILSKPTTSDANRLKAVQLQQQAMNRIPDGYFKTLTEIYS